MLDAICAGPGQRERQAKYACSPLIPPLEPSRETAVEPPTASHMTWNHGDSARGTIPFRGYCGSFRIDSSGTLVWGGWDAHAELVRSSRDAAAAPIKCAKNGTTVGPRA